MHMIWCLSDRYHLAMSFLNAHQQQTKSLERNATTLHSPVNNKAREQHTDKDLYQ